jgi:hypothetical protein
MIRRPSLSYAFDVSGCVWQAGILVTRGSVLSSSGFYLPHGLSGRKALLFDHRITRFLFFLNPVELRLQKSRIYSASL